MPSAARPASAAVAPAPAGPSARRGAPAAHPRAWARARGPATTLVVKCMLGSPETPLPAHYRKMKHGELRALLQKNGLDTKGGKPALLRRLQTEVPWVAVEIDERECFQRLVLAALHFFGWDNIHAFGATIPRRGPLRAGVVRLKEMIGDVVALCAMYPNLSETSRGEDAKMAAAVKEMLDERSCSWDDFHALRKDPEALSDVRSLIGTGYEMKMGAAGVVTIADLCLEEGDKIDLIYDFGDSHKFTFVVEKVQRSDKRLPQKDLGYEMPTCARENSRGPARVPRQYDDNECSDEE